MPNRDGTGPNGQGPRTGRGAGNCEPKNSSDNNFCPRGRGRGQGRGLGRQAQA